MEQSVALRLPFIDGQNHEWCGLSLKTSPMSNFSLTADARRIAVRRFPRSIVAYNETHSRHREESPFQLSARAPANHNERWPAHVERAFGSSTRWLLARGTLFDFYIHDPVEPRRSGTYEFAIVGVDITDPQRLRYYAWDHTGHFDRSFSSDEIDHRLSLRRYGRSVSLGSRARVPTERAHSKQDIGQGVVRWPDFATTEGLLHGQMLPAVDERGRPVLPASSRFLPRNSTDLLMPMLLRWKERFARQELPGPLRFLVLDGSGRFASYVQDEFPGATVEAVDDPPRHGGEVLKKFRDRQFHPVQEAKMGGAEPVLHFGNGAFDVVLLPFVFHRVCGGEERRFLSLLREALRVAVHFVLVAEEVVAQSTDEAAVRRWKSYAVGQHSATVVLSGELRAGAVLDHHLCAAEPAPGEAKRRFLILRTSPAHPDERLSGPASAAPSSHVRKWRAGVTGTAPQVAEQRPEPRGGDRDTKNGG